MTKPYHLLRRETGENAICRGQRHAPNMWTTFARKQQLVKCSDVLLSTESQSCKRTYQWLSSSGEEDTIIRVCAEGLVECEALLLQRDQ